MRKRPIPGDKKSRKDREDLLREVCDGKLAAREVAEVLSYALGYKVPATYVQLAARRLDLPRLAQAPRSGSNNPAWTGGRTIDRDGYVLVVAPSDHPYARIRETRKRLGRNSFRILEHRLVMESKLGRYLSPSEVVDHIDGLRLHNSPQNLRLFVRNSEHLKTTITGQVPQWSAAGYANMCGPQGRAGQPVDTHLKRKRCGDVRLQQILRAALSLGIESPFLLGSSRYLEKAGIFDLSRSNLEHELDLLYQRYA